MRCSIKFSRVHLPLSQEAAPATHSWPLLQQRSVRGGASPDQCRQSAMLCYYSHSLHPTPRPLGGQGQAWAGDESSENVLCVNKQSAPVRAQLSAPLRSMSWSFSVFAAKRGLKSAIIHCTGGDFEMRDFLCAAADCYLCSCLNARVVGARDVQTQPEKTKHSWP